MKMGHLMVNKNASVSLSSIHHSRKPFFGLQKGLKQEKKDELHTFQSSF